MNLIFYQKVDFKDPRSYNAASRNGAYAKRRGLRFFKYDGDDLFGTLLQEMKGDEECEGAVVLLEHEWLTVDGLERDVDGLSFRVTATPTKDFTEKLGKFFFRKNKEGLAKLETFAASKKSGVPTKENEDGNSYENEGDQRERRRPRRGGSALPRDCEISAPVGRSVISNDNGNSYGNESDQRERVESIARERGSSAATSPPPELKEPKKTKTTKSKKKQKAD